jgi:hypothetical protein
MTWIETFRNAVQRSPPDPSNHGTNSKPTIRYVVQCRSVSTKLLPLPSARPAASILDHLTKHQFPSRQRSPFVSVDRSELANECRNLVGLIRRGHVLPGRKGHLGETREECITDRARPKDVMMSTCEIRRANRCELLACCPQDLLRQLHGLRVKAREWGRDR